MMLLWLAILAIFTNLANIYIYLYTKKGRFARNLNQGEGARN